MLLQKSMNLRENLHRLRPHQPSTLKRILYVLAHPVPTIERVIEQENLSRIEDDQRSDSSCNVSYLLEQR